ncbi:carbon-nitrogen hydrolase family protein [Bordetella bronchiseptica]|uniref:carbon-nitrogen hydrolase family protein n=1 Tax=Bordetella bronchiseptica TaxID=518 RepID=UPI00028A5888|nr:carbon-nitrogen hydrolase family protein [Bordetella bronchiseptica]KCV29090.1 hydrolase, carbon-nitrogen family [Bordetella bronchiseptica 00-P-2730]AWQ06194.1 acyltransferase [Bordetella bronchiseptica]AZW31778.1 carbon-nitrogen hydrolase family protein [Bordetella bronchiseptica]QET71296.1 carbon-nitrogen hydrolase family protein [Bordetella bronchiseptica]RSB99407.1 carbon-nitrogen hydrolase family protein [Bordetella bronchiseptica]
MTGDPRTDTNPSCRVAAIQMVSGPDVDENLAQAAELIGKAAQDGARLVALPEYFCFMGHTDTDKLAIKEESGYGKIQSFLSNISSQYGIWVAGGTLPLTSPDPQRVFNTTFVYGPGGQPAARYDKIHLFNFQRGAESYDEAIAIRPGKAVQVFDGPCGRVGLSVCYDLRFPELYRAMGTVDLILVPAAFTYTTGQAHWELLLRARAIENQCYVLAPAQGGRHPTGRRTWGHSMLVDPWGQVLDVLPEGPGVIGGTIEAARLAEVRASLPALRHRVL